MGFPKKRPARPALYARGGRVLFYTPAAAVVSIDVANFPDTKFREYVKANWDSDDNGILSDTEIAAVKSVRVSSKGIESLKGIEYFTALKELYCWSNRLTELDVSKNTKLEGLHCEKNRLTFLDLRGLGDLVSTDVDVGGQTRDGLKVRKIGSEYAVDLGVFLPSDRWGNVSRLAGKNGGTDLVARYDSASGKASFTAKPEKVTYQYDTGNGDCPMEVTLTTELVSPDVSVPPAPPSGPDVPPTPPVTPHG